LEGYDVAIKKHQKRYNANHFHFTLEVVQVDPPVLLGSLATTTLVHVDQAVRTVHRVVRRLVLRTATTHNCSVAISTQRYYAVSTNNIFYAWE